MPQWWLSADVDAPAGSWQVHGLEAVKLHGDGVVAKLAGIDDRDASEALGSCYFGAPRDALPPPATTLPTTTLPTPMATATPTTSFVKLNLI